MQNRKEALRIRAELALWGGRKAIHQPRLKALKSKYILEQDDVNRMEVGLSGFLAKRKRDYDEKLEKEKAEVTAAKAELDRMTELIRIADEKLADLEGQAKAYQEFWETADLSAFSGDEKVLLDWCQQAEICLRLAKETNLCIVRLKEEQESFTGVEGNSSVLLALQKRIDLIWINGEALIKTLGNEKGMLERKHDLSFLAEDDPILVKAAKTFPCRLTENLAVFDTASEFIRTNNSLYGLEEELREFRKLLADIFEKLVEKGEELLGRLTAGESHTCEIGEGLRQEEAEPMIKEEVSSIPLPSAEDSFFGQVDLEKEKERVLLGLNLLREEFVQNVASAEGMKLGKGLLHRNDDGDERLDRISSWERALREWQQDLKLYRKNAGNFPCALDGYELLEKKIWQYTDSAELEKACRGHLQDTAERLEQAEKQIRDYER